MKCIMSVAQLIATIHTICRNQSLNQNLTVIHTLHPYFNV